MGIRDDIPPYLHKAADLFFEELGPHLDAIEELAKSSPGILSPQACSEVSQRFHTIRGGAGFLKLASIAEYATAGEKESEDGTIQSARVIELVTAIRRQLD